MHSSARLSHHHRLDNVFVGLPELDQTFHALVAHLGDPRVGLVVVVLLAFALLFQDGGEDVLDGGLDVVDGDVLLLFLLFGHFLIEGSCWVFVVEIR